MSICANETVIETEITSDLRNLIKLRSAHAAGFLKREISAFRDAGAWNDPALWIIIQQTYLEMLGLLGYPHDSFLPTPRFPLPLNERLLCKKDPARLTAICGEYASLYFDLELKKSITWDGDSLIQNNKRFFPGLLTIAAFSETTFNLYKLKDGRLGWSFRGNLKPPIAPLSPGEKRIIRTTEAAAFFVLKEMSADAFLNEDFDLNQINHSAIFLGQKPTQSTMVRDLTIFANATRLMRSEEIQARIPLLMSTVETCKAITKMAGVN